MKLEALTCLLTAMALAGMAAANPKDPPGKPAVADAKPATKPAAADAKPATKPAAADAQPTEKPAKPADKKSGDKHAKPAAKPAKQARPGARKPARSDAKPAKSSSPAETPEAGAASTPVSPASAPASSAAPLAPAPAAPGEPGAAVAGASLDKATEKEKRAAAAELRQGRSALDAKNFTEALAKFRASYAIVASPNSRMMIARALASLGRTLDAYHEAESALAEATAAAAKNPKYQATADGVRADLAELEKKIAIVTVKVTGVPDEATLTVAGKTIEPASWGKPIALEPGTIEVALKTPDGVARRTVSAAAGAKLTVPIEMPRAHVADVKPPPAEPKRMSSYRGPDRKIMGYSAAGVGGLGLLLFGTFGALANGQYSRLSTGCPSQQQCDPGLADVASRGKTYQNAANGMLVVGLLGIATGAGLIVWNGLDGGGWPFGSAAVGRPRLAIGVGQAALGADF